IREIVKPVAVVPLFIFFDLTPEQQTKIHFGAYYHFVIIFSAQQVDINEEGILSSMPKERIVENEVVSLITHIGDLQGIPGPLFETKGKSTRRITEFTVTALGKPHGSKGHPFPAL